MYACGGLLYAATNYIAYAFYIFILCNSGCDGCPNRLHSQTTDNRAIVLLFVIKIANKLKFRLKIR